MVRRDLEHRSYERANHAAEEAICGDLELEHVWRVHPAGFEDRALEDLVFGDSWGERAKVMFAEEEGGGVVESFAIDWSRIPPGAAGLER